MSSDGEYIFSFRDKLVYTDGNYYNPKILKVITFNTDNENEINYARETIYDYEQWNYNISDAIEIAEIVLGKTFITFTDYENYGTDRNVQDDGREGNAGGKTYNGSGEDVESHFGTYIFGIILLIIDVRS